MEQEAAWAEAEFGLAELGDARRTARLVQIASSLGARPSASLPQSSVDGAALKAAYRFFDNEAVRAEDILASHVASTVERMQTVPRVLAVQDTTLLDWSHHPATTGLGPLAQADRQGLLAHTTLAVSEERVPLGVLAQQVWARDPETFGQQAKQRRSRPVREKESAKWLHSLHAVNALAAHAPQSQFISIGDREADVYDLFLLPRAATVEVLVRAAWDRRVAHPERHLWEYARAQPATTVLTVELPRQGARAARSAEVALRYGRVTLRPPKARAPEKLPPVEVSFIYLCEEDAPAGEPPLEWLLLTTLPINTLEAALRAIEWYQARWGIEVWHKVLKSGCGMEMRQLADAARLKRLLSLLSVIAWRILYATMLARRLPDDACEVLLERDEWQALACRIQRTATPPETPPTLQQAVRWIAQLGGFPGRTRDGHPGPLVLWKGFQRLIDLTDMYRIMRPPPLRKNVGKD